MLHVLSFQHSIKKLRNILEKSRKNGTRLLTIGNSTIEWDFLYQAYKWDQTINSLKIHHHLKEEHFNLGYASRMLI